MVGVEGIAEWIGREVVDRDGEKVGRLEDVYFDTTDHEPVFVSLKSGAFGRSQSVAPLAGATLSRDYVRLDATKELVKDAPEDTSGGRLTGVDAVAVLRHFGLPAEADLDGETRVCFQTAGAEEESERKRAEVAAEESRDAGDGGAVVAASPAPETDGAPSPAASSPAPGATADRHDLLARLEELENRVAALERR